MRPLLVTATMASAIVSEHDVHLDALLEYAVAKRELGELVLDRSAPREQIRHFDLPIRRWTGPGGESVWGASCWMLSDDAGLHPELTRITKRKSAEDVSQLARPWTPGAGSDRNRRVQKQAVCAASVAWWAEGDPLAVRDLIQDVSHIGAMRRHGNGAVSAWSVGVVDGPVPVLLDDEGRLTRSIPWSWVVPGSADAGPVHAAYRAPYWHPAMQGPVAVAGTRVLLCDGIC